MCRPKHCRNLYLIQLALQALALSVLACLIGKKNHGPLAAGSSILAVAPRRVLCGYTHDYPRQAQGKWARGTRPACGCVCPSSGFP